MVFSASKPRGKSASSLVTLTSGMALPSLEMNFATCSCLLEDGEQQNLSGIHRNADDLHVGVALLQLGHVAHHRVIAYTSGEWRNIAPSANLAKKKTMVSLLLLYSTGSPLRYFKEAMDGAG